MAAALAKMGPGLQKIMGKGSISKMIPSNPAEILGKISPMDLFNNLFTSDQFFSLSFNFKKEISDVFKKVKSKTCIITGTKEFRDIIANSVIDNIKKSFKTMKNENEENDENRGEKGGNTFYEELYDLFFRLLLKHDNPDLHLFIIEKYKGLVDYIEQIEIEQTQTMEVEGNNKEKEYLNSFIENVIGFNELFIEILMNNERFLNSMAQNPEFLRLVVEKPNSNYIGNEFIEKFANYSKTADKLEIKKFIEELNRIYFKKLVEIENLEGGAGSSDLMNFVSKNASKVGNFMPKKMPNMKDLNVKKFADNYIPKDIQNTIQQNVKDTVINNQPKSNASTTPEETKTEEKGSILSNIKDKMATEIQSKIMDSMTPKPTEAGPETPAVETSSDYFSLVKIKSEIKDTFTKIREKICDIIGRKEFHDFLQESIFDFIETHIHNTAPSISSSGVHNLFFYKLYHILFKITPDKEEQNYKLLETHCQTILSHLKENHRFFKESESEHVNMKQDEKELLTSQYRCVNMFIEKVIVNQDSNLFMDKLFKNEHICSLIFQHPLFFKWILKSEIFSENLVDIWFTPVLIDDTTKLISDNETKEDKEAEKEEGVIERLILDTDVMKEKQGKFKEFLSILSQRLSYDIGDLGVIGDLEKIQTGGGCSDEIMDILKIPMESVGHTMIESIKTTITESSIGKQYQMFLFDNFELLSSNDAKNLYEETIGKPFTEIYKETEYFKRNKLNPESDEDTFVYHMTQKENRFEFIKYIYNVPNRKGFAILMNFLLNENKLKNNRLFMFRKLFEKMSPQDMRMFLSSIKGELDCGGKKGGAIEDISEEESLLIQIATGLLTELVKEEKEKEEGQEEPDVTEEEMSKTDDCEKLNNIVIPECMNTKTYRELAKKIHPDKNPNCKEIATKKFQKLNNAEKNENCKENKNEESDKPPNKPPNKPKRDGPPIPETESKRDGPPIPETESKSEQTQEEQTLPENLETQNPDFTFRTSDEAITKNVTDNENKTSDEIQKTETECSSKMEELLKKIQKENAGPPMDAEILEKLITHSISKENIEILFQQELLDKIQFPRNEIENTVKRFMVFLLSPDKSSASIQTELDISNKTKIIERVLLEMSNYDVRSVISSVFEYLSKAPVISKTIYPQLMKKFYDSYGNSEKMKTKINELINTIQTNGNNNTGKKQIINQLCNQQRQNGNRKTYRKRFQGEKL
jgi:hypothetical protein